MDALPDLGSTGDAELKALIDHYVKEENETSYRRRILHGYIDILKAELLARKKSQYESGTLDTIDIDQLSSILSGKSLPSQGSNDE